MIRYSAGLLLLVFLGAGLLSLNGNTGGATQAELWRSLQQRPRDVALLNSYGISQAQAGDLIGAVRTWRYAVDIDPAYVHLYNNIGGALRRLGHQPDALAWFHAALQRKNDAWWIWYNVALLHLDLRNEVEARVALEQVLRINPGYHPAREHLAGLKPPSRDSMKQPDTVHQPQQFAMPTKLPVEIPRQQPVEISTRKPAAISTRQAAVDPAPQAVAKSNRHSGSKPMHRPETITTPFQDRSTMETKPLPLPLPGDGGGQVFLTFDAGAGKKGFDRILASLQAFGVRSTFFLTGKWVEEYPDLARQIEAQGHEIANHSYSHKDMKFWSLERIRPELEQAEQAFHKVLGHRSAPYFRFPFGHQTKTSEGHVEKLGYRPVYWNIDTIDWREDPVPAIIKRVTTKIRRGAVILMHVGSNNGATALPTILTFLTQNGFQPARLSDLNPSQLAALP